MNTVSIMLVVAGIACLVVGGVLLYRMMPRNGQPVTLSDTAETALALSQFTLMIAGISLIAKGIL